MTTAGLSTWVTGARTRTLPAAVAPVFAGTCAAVAFDSFNPVMAGLALVVALALQVGVNYANDYSDGIRGTDAHRVGPTRLVASGLVPPHQVRRAAFAAFGVAMIAGSLLVMLSRTWYLMLVGVGLLIAAWFYTGGKRPYGYRGFGELAVLVCFGIVPVLGTTYTQALRIDAATVALALGTGLLASALLVANNLRDIPTDTRSGKRTLAVILGDNRTRLLYAGMVAGAFALIVPMASLYPWAWITLLCAPLAVAPLRTVLDGRQGPNLIPVLAATTRLELVYAVLAGVGLILSSYLAG